MRSAHPAGRGQGSSKPWGGSKAQPLVRATTMSSWLGTQPLSCSSRVSQQPPYPKETSQWLPSACTCRCFDCSLNASLWTTTCCWSQRRGNSRECRWRESPRHITGEPCLSARPALSGTENPAASGVTGEVSPVLAGQTVFGWLCHVTTFSAAVGILIFVF